MFGEQPHLPFGLIPQPPPHTDNFSKLALAIFDAMKYIPSFLAIQRKPRPSMAAWRASHTKLPKLLRASATSSQLSLQKAILNASAQGDAQGIIQVLVEGQSIMSAVNVATAAHRLAKLRPRKSLKERSMQQLQADVDLILDTLMLLKCQKPCN